MASSNINKKPSRPNLSHGRNSLAKNSRGNNEQILGIVEKLVDKLNDTSIKELCTNCGRVKHTSGEICPARGKHCNNCKQPNHFSNVCNQNKRENNSAKTCNQCGQAWHENGQICPAKGMNLMNVCFNNQI